jgi:hypothetical protein
VINLKTQVSSLIPIEVAYENLSSVLDRLEQDFKSAIFSWAVWEALNGYPLGSRREKLRMFVSATFDAQTLKIIQACSVSTTIMSLTRMMDYVDDKKPSDKLALNQLLKVISRQDFLPFLFSDCDQEGRVVKTSVLRTEVELMVEELINRLKGGSRERSIEHYKPALKKVRDHYIAHSLADVTIPQINPFLIRDGIMLTGRIIILGNLVIRGKRWNPKYYWRVQLKNAQFFWDRYERGFEQ